MTVNTDYLLVKTGCSIIHSRTQKLVSADDNMKPCSVAVLLEISNWSSYFTKSFLPLPLSSLLIFPLTHSAHYSPHFCLSPFCLFDDPFNLQVIRALC
jgi:hypothetical protein